MIARKVLHAAAGAAVVAAGMLVMASEAAADCKRHTHVGRGTGLLRATAGISARNDWRREVADHDGFEFSRWSRARGRVTACRRAEGARWSCTARARPCN